jgi:phosphatidylglycerophosphatase A
MLNQETFVRKNLWKNPIHLLAFGFGVGLSPKFPGTLGTLLAVPIYYFLLSPLPLRVYLLVLLFFILMGCWICRITTKALGIDDYPGIVLDEMLGYWVTMIALPATWYFMVLAFFWFRVFDIWKPWPISWVEEKVKGGVGVVLDDLLAGIVAWAVLLLVNHLLTGLFLTAA